MYSPSTRDHMSLSFLSPFLGQSLYICAWLSISLSYSNLLSRTDPVKICHFGDCYTGYELGRGDREDTGIDVNTYFIILVTIMTCLQ